MSKRPVTPEELREFVANYPRRPETDVWGVSEPPMITWNDFTLGNWPESVVCGRYDGSDNCWIIEPDNEWPFRSIPVPTLTVCRAG